MAFLKYMSDSEKKIENSVLESASLKSESGVALIIVLVYSSILLVVMAALLYMVTSGIQVSGMQKNYKTALEAGLGGTGIVQQFVSLRGEEISQAAFVITLNSFNLNSAVTTSLSCTGTDLQGDPYSGLAAKLKTASTSWSATCNNSLALNPSDAATYDVRMEMGTTTKYTVYAKIADTVEGNSGGGEGLLNKGVVSSNSGDVTVMSIPYLYTIEVDAENSLTKTERAKLQVLYQY